MTGMTDQEDPLEAIANQARSNWGWFVALGVLLVLLGFVVLGNVALATVASVSIFGATMILAGLASASLAFRGRDWKEAMFAILAGVIYGLGGVAMLLNPLLASGVLTLFIAAAILLGGVVRIWYGISTRPASGWGWMVAAGAVSLSLGIVIATGWPNNSLSVIGLFLGVDLLIQGASWLAIGMFFRARI